MTRRALWLPGEFPTTNRLLDIQRASGFHEGVRRERGGKGPRAATTFAGVTSRIREQAGLMARAARLAPVPEGERLPLLFVHYGSGRRDASAWYLSAKAIEDGLVDAGVIGSDRFNVSFTAGTSVSVRDRTWVDRAAVLTGVEPQGREGMLVALGVPVDGLL